MRRTVVAALQEYGAASTMGLWRTDRVGCRSRVTIGVSEGSSAVTDVSAQFDGDELWWFEHAVGVPGAMGETLSFRSAAVAPDCKLATDWSDTPTDTYAATIAVDRGTIYYANQLGIHQRASAL